jgi:hypothetical protein
MSPVHSGNPFVILLARISTLNQLTGEQKNAPVFPRHGARFS